MRLYITGPSPYARKILVALRELGLADPVQLIDAALPQYGSFPASRDPHLAAENPLGKVPCLVTDSGESLFDSVVIAEYLDTLVSEHALCPAGGDERWRALQRQALADGMLDAGVQMRLEQLRPAALRWPLMLEAQREKIERALNTLETDASLPAAPFSIGVIALVCALDWLEFRDITSDWRAGHPRLARWHEGISQRPSLISTRPS